MIRGTSSAKTKLVLTHRQILATQRWIIYKQTHEIHKDIYMLNFSYHTNRTRIYNNFDPIQDIQVKQLCTDTMKQLLRASIDTRLEDEQTNEK